jgi:hypothetical protein
MQNWFVRCELAVVLMFVISDWWGHAVAQLFEALRYKPEGRGFDCVIGIFH